MPLPNSKQELADWILRRLGAPVVNVELTDLQLEDAIDEAVQMFQNWHFDGAQRSYRVIKVTQEMLNGNSRIHQDLSAPMYDPVDNDGYRIGDRVMTYTANSQPDTIWVKYDSEDREVKRFYQPSEAGYWIQILGTNVQTTGKTDSDNGFVVYDSDVHNIVNYYIDNADGVVDLSSYFVDSDGAYVLYDSDKHKIYQYDLVAHDATTTSIFFVDSEGSYVAYDSDKHKSVSYELFTGERTNQILFVDSDGVYSRYDSDKHFAWAYNVDSDGLYVDSDSVYVLFDSDKHTHLDYFEIAKSVDSDGSNDLWYKTTDSEFRKIDAQSYEDFLNYASGTAVYNNRRQIDSDFSFFVDGIYVPVKNGVRNFTLKGATDTDFDSDGYGNLLQFFALNDYRVTFSVNIGAVNVKIEELTSVNPTATPLGSTVVQIQNVDGSLTNVDIPKLTRSIKDSFPNKSLFSRKAESSVQRFSKDRIEINTYLKNATPINVYTRQFTIPTLYSRLRFLNGVRYDHIDSEVDSQTLSFEEMWRKEKVVLSEPQLNIDYSKQGQIGIQIPEDIIAVSKVFRIDSAVSAGMWNYEYQFFLTNFDWFYGSGGGAGQAMTSYYTTKSYLEMIDHMLNTTPAIRFNKHKNRLFIDTDWKKIANKYTDTTPVYMLAEVYEITDPDIFGDVYKDTWLKRYALALTKEQWGSNLKKYSGVDLPGGLQVDGQALYDEAKEEKEKLEEELKTANLEMDSILLG